MIRNLVELANETGDDIDGLMAKHLRAWLILRDNDWSLEAKVFKPPEKIDLEVEWQKQTEKLASLFAAELGMSPEDYTASLPKFQPLPENLKDQFRVPAIIETRVGLIRTLNIFGYSTEYVADNDIKDWEKNRFVTPEEPYAVWLDARKFDNARNIRFARACSGPDGRGGTAREGLVLSMLYPELLDNHLILPGSEWVSEYALQFGQMFAPQLYGRGNIKSHFFSMDIDVTLNHLDRWVIAGRF